MSKLSIRLRHTAEWIDRTRDGPGLRELISARLLEMAESAVLLEADAEAMPVAATRPAAWSASHHRQ
jgi:hypothetical protein